MLISSYDTVEDIMVALQQKVSYTMKPSWMGLNQENVPTITIEVPSREIPEDVFNALIDLGVLPVSPIQYVKRATGGYGAKFGLRSVETKNDEEDVSYLEEGMNRFRRYDR